MKMECLTSLLAAISLLSTVAQAEVIQGTFSGVVTSATGTADGIDLTTLVGRPITGKFSYDSTTMLYIPLSAGGCDPAYCGSFASDPVAAPITMTNTVAGHTFRVTGTSYSDLHVDIAGGIYTTNFFRLNSQNVPFGTPRPGDNACAIIIGLTNYGGPPFMSDASDSGTVNFVNAGLLAEQTGIEVRETISLESGDYRNLIRLIVTEGEDQEFVIAGTVLEHKHPRIVQIGDFPIVFVPEGRMAYVPHKNVPGVIGRVGTIMGEYGVNISRMVTSSGDNNVSRDSIMLLGLDNDVPQEAIDRCLEIDEIYEMKIIDF